MLKELYVKNIALISEADVEFDSGLNVLSGETGSGKSVILDSINFVLGCKADRTMIRYGEQDAMVRAVFSVDKNCKAVQKLDEYDIDSDGLIIISRKLTADGRGSIKVNGNTVTASMLKNITQHLVDVHGQSEHFFLLSESNQLKVLDSLLGQKAEKIKNELASLISEKREYNQKIQHLGGDEAERIRKLDLLEYQINEIENADLKIGEFDELKARQNILLNVEKILFALNSARSILTDDGGCCDGISSAIHEVMRVSHISEKYLHLCDRLESLNADASDISETITDLVDGLTYDEGEARQIEERITLIKSLFKKYGADEQQVLNFKEEAKAQYNSISDSAATIEKYNREIDKCDERIYSLCVELTKLRKYAAESFCTNVINELKTLNIPDAKFSVIFNEYDRKSANISSNGCDVISFEFSANKGEPLKPLNKVISGGEISRFMLAVKAQLKNLNGISTYIFDEIDSGVSGFTAGTVARKFLDIARHTQILAVSHLPQVCAASHAQFLIYKIEENGKTFTKIKKLSENQKTDEIIRLTGNVDSETARRHAEELINQFKII